MVEGRFEKYVKRPYEEEKSFSNEKFTRTRSKDKTGKEVCLKKRRMMVLKNNNMIFDCINFCINSFYKLCSYASNQQSIKKKENVSYIQNTFMMFLISIQNFVQLKKMIKKHICHDHFSFAFYTQKD